MARYFMTLSYDGEHFSGWQIQENTPQTVQQLLEEKLEMLLRRKIQVVGCGRTDAGVNAVNYVAHFDTDAPVPADFPLLYKLNVVLPHNVSVSSIQPVRSTAHARFDAVERAYFYYVIRSKNVFRQRYSWHIHGELDFELMNQAAHTLLGQQDFASFSKSNTQNKTTICNIYAARWQKIGEQEWRFTIRADRFLRGMVRAVVGTLVMVGQGKIAPSKVGEIIASRDRRNAGPSAPANALFFAGVRYPKEVFNV